MGSRNFNKEGSGLKTEASPISLTLSSSKKIEELQEVQATNFVHLK